DDLHGAVDRVAVAATGDRQSAAFECLVRAGQLLLRELALHHVVLERRDELSFLTRVGDQRLEQASGFFGERRVQRGENGERRGGIEGRHHTGDRRGGHDRLQLRYGCSGDGDGELRCGGELRGRHSQRGAPRAPRQARAGRGAARSRGG